MPDSQLAPVRKAQIRDWDCLGQLLLSESGLPVTGAWTRVRESSLMNPFFYWSE